MRRLPLLLCLVSSGALAKIAAPTADVANRPPEFELPPYHRVAPGREIAFGLNVADQDGDTVRVELVEKPASASYDPVTLTVRWKPTAKDAPQGRFVVRVTETQRKGGGRRAFLHDFAIAVDKKAKDLPAPPPLGPAVELLITIHDPERLAQVNKDWPILKMFEVLARLEKAKGPKAGTADARALYDDAIRAVGARHGNKRADPVSKEFDPKAWVITAVRPRMDKKVQELRVVYENVRVPEPMYLMFRWRLAKDSPDLPAEAKDLNNKELSRLVHEAFFVGADLNPKHVTDKKAHGKAVSTFVGKVLDYKSDQPNMGTEFLALPHEARFGGGSARAGDGSYVSGDGWAWAVLKAKWEGEKLTIVSVPIPGFTSDVKPSADGTSWQTVCAPKFDPDDKRHAPGYEALCRKKLGFTDLPMTVDGKIAPSPIDATNLFVDHKMGDMVATVPLRDPRRDNFEENGMTCSQCHIRDFANGDLRDAATRDPRAGKPRAPSPPIPTLMFNIVPEESWRPFTIEFMRFQECLFRDAFKKHLGQETKLTCPLVAE
jgi:hypothetical protein